MKKHRKLFKNFFLAVLCVGFVFVGGYIYTNAANCGCASILLKSGAYQPKVTAVKYNAAADNYTVTVSLKLGEVRNSEGHRTDGYWVSPATSAPNNFRVGFANSVTEYAGVSLRYSYDASRRDYRVAAKSDVFDAYKVYNVRSGKSGTDKALYDAWYNSTASDTVTLELTVTKPYKYVVVSMHQQDNWTVFDPHGTANTHSTANANYDKEYKYSIFARSEDISSMFHTHNWKWVIDTNATCISTGTMHQECDCGKKKSENTVIGKTGCNYVWIIDTYPTCATTGKKHEQCSTCGSTRNADTVIDKTTTHTWPAGFDYTSVTGYHIMNCTICGTRLATIANTYYVGYTAPKPNGASTNVTGYTPTTTAIYDQEFYLSGTEYTLPGYHCNSGWLNAANQSVNNPAKNLTTIHTATVTLYHTWAPNPYKVQFNATKPSYATGVTGATAAYTQNFVFDTAQSLTANRFAYTGAVLLGWATTSGGTKVYNDRQSVKSLTTTKDGTYNLYATWRPVKYYVRFNRNLHDASGPDSKKVGVFEYGQSYTALTQNATGMSRDGYYIAYWTTNADGTGTRYYAGDKDWPAGTNSVVAQFKNLTSVDGATVDLYAHWEPIPYTLVYHKNDSNGGTNPAGGNTASYAETTVRYYNDTKPLLANKWTRVNELNVPSVFRGWNLLADVNSTDNSVKYTARWSNTGNFVNGDSCTLCTTRDGTVDIYTVWDDVPVLIAQDYEIPYSTNSGDTIGDLVSRDSDGGLVLSQTALEEILLKNAVSKHSDREDGVLELGEHFFIKYFRKDTYTDLDSPTSFEVKYTVTDSTGNSYTQSAMLYGSYLIRIDIQ